MNDFEKFKNDILSNVSPYTAEQISKEVDDLNKKANEKNFPVNLSFLITESTAFSIEKAKEFCIAYIEEYHKWLCENYDLIPKSDIKD